MQRIRTPISLVTTGWRMKRGFSPDIFNFGQACGKCAGATYHWSIPMRSFAFMPWNVKMNFCIYETFSYAKVTYGKILSFLFRASFLFEWMNIFNYLWLVWIMNRKFTKVQKNQFHRLEFSESSSNLLRKLFTWIWVFFYFNDHGSRVQNVLTNFHFL